jgi:hypothetical protein
MIEAITYSLDGYELHTAVQESKDLISSIEADKAIETWKAGLVRGDLAISIKTVESVNRFLEDLPEGTLIAITYQLVGTENELAESRTLRHFLRKKQPVLLSNGAHSLSDRQIVRQLEARLGSYIRVTYRAIERHSAPVTPHNPWCRAYAVNDEAKILVGV